MTSKWTVSRAAPWQTESTRITCTRSLQRRLHFCSELWNNDDLNIHTLILDLKRGPQAVLVYLWVWLLSSSTSPFMGWYYLLCVQLYEPRMPEMELWHIACRGCFITKSKNTMDFFFFVSVYFPLKYTSPRGIFMEKVFHLHILHLRQPVCLV